MNNTTSKPCNGSKDEEDKSAELLTKRMGLGKNELELINNQYGVSASQLLELIQYSKYKFVYTDKNEWLIA